MTILWIIVIVIVGLCAYGMGALHERERARRERLSALLADPDACRFGQEETGGYFIGRRHCHTHNEHEDLGKPRCPVGEEHDKEPQRWAAHATQAPLLAAGMPVAFEQGEFVVLEVTSTFENGEENRLAPNNTIEVVPVGSKVRTHVRMVDRESYDRDHRILPWPAATDWNVPGA